MSGFPQGVLALALEKKDDATFIFLILLSLFWESIKCHEYIGESEAFGEPH